MISFGSVFLELVFGQVPKLPRPGEEIFTDEFAISCGGAVTSASAAARAGAAAGLCTVLGDDLGCRVVSEFCATAGVRLSPSLRVARRSAGITVVLNFDGDRAFVTHVPPRSGDEQRETERWREVLRRERPRWCYLHAGPGVPAFLRDAREAGSKVVLDVSLGDEKDRAIVLDCVRLADVFVPNEAELQRLTGMDTTESAVAAAAPWGTPLVVTRGAAGALVADRSGVTDVRDGIRAIPVRDLTGAGDNFAGAMIAALAGGAGLVQAVTAGNAAGSESVGRLGAVGEVQVAGISAPGRTLGAMFIDRVAAIAARDGTAGQTGLGTPATAAAPVPRAGGQDGRGRIGTWRTRGTGRVKLAILGGGGVRMPAFVRAVLTRRPGAFREICLYEPDPRRRDTICRLATEIAAALGRPGTVTITGAAAEAFTGADYVFSAIRVGGDRARVIDEQVALERGLVGQETTGPGGCAMALRTIPVVLSYCDLLSQCAPDAVLVNFTNPAGLITQAISAQGKVRAVGVCDTPGGTVARLAEFLGADGCDLSGCYAGLNHLGWVCSVRAGGQERIGDLLARFADLQAFDHRFAAFDADLVRRVGAIPAEYVYYYYDAKRYLDGVAKAGASRGQDVLRLNEELLTAVAAAFGNGDGVQSAWAAYDTLLGVRRDTYMRTDTDGDSGQGEARARRAAAGVAGLDGGQIGGYEGLALKVIDALAGHGACDVIVNTSGAGGALGLDADDVVEVPVRVDTDGITPLGVPELPRSARALVAQVKEYERGVVEAAVHGDAGLAGVALAQHPLVPGITAARELIAEYVRCHGEHLAYLQ
jgi:6-phospho-beta-glucosidase